MIGELLYSIDDYTGSRIVRAALRMAPYIFVRPGELRRAEWSEFNFEVAEWHILAAKMKMRQVHIVPLVRQIVSILEDLRQYTGKATNLWSILQNYFAEFYQVKIILKVKLASFFVLTSDLCRFNFIKIYNRYTTMSSFFSGVNFVAPGWWWRISSREGDVRP
jgi:integrase